MRFLLWMPLVVSLSVAPVAAVPIDYSSLAELEATGIGPRIAHREQDGFTDGRYEDGSVATGGVYGFFPEWFSSVYFNGTLYTYVYGVTELICANCDADYYVLVRPKCSAVHWSAPRWATGGARSTSRTALTSTASRVLFPSHRPLRASPSQARGCLVLFAIRTCPCRHVWTPERDEPDH